MTLNLDSILEHLFWGGPYKIGDGLPPPVEKPKQAAPKVKPKPVSDWEDLPPMKCSHNGKEWTEYMQKRITKDGTEYRRANGPKTSKHVPYALTDGDIAELNKRNVSLETGAVAKRVYSINQDISAGDLAKEIKKGIRTCENCLASFRAAAGLK